jgi:hypothetical protein
MRSHGLSHHPLYPRWIQIKQRCTNPNSDSWPDYGGRGISMHPAWADDFAKFLADVGDSPGPEWSLDRKNNNLGYEPGNLRWARRTTQAMNRRTAGAAIAAAMTEDPETTTTTRPLRRSAGRGR